MESIDVWSRSLVAQLGELWRDGQGVSATVASPGACPQAASHLLDELSGAEELAAAVNHLLPLFGLKHSRTSSDTRRPAGRLLRAPAPHLGVVHQVLVLDVVSSSHHKDDGLKQTRGRVRNLQDTDSRSVTL